MNRSDANRRPPDSHAKAAAYRDAIGLSPSAFKVIVAVLSFERSYGASPTSGDVRRFLNVHDLQLNELTRGLWLTADGESNGTKRLTARARARAWSVLGVERDVRRSA